MGQIIYITAAGQRYAVPGAAGTSIMQLATAHAVPGINADCGGSMSCATCHVYIDADWVDRVGPPRSGESAMLEYAEAPQANSRLSCQIRYRDELDGLIVHIPAAQ